MKILVFGASGSGTTTLAKEFSKVNNFIHLDADNFYWKDTSPPFQIKIPLQERSKKLMNALDNHQKVIISGSLSTWGKEWLTAFDLGVFLYLNPEIRIKRLLNREIHRYGPKESWDPKTIETSKNFIEWAKQYDEPAFDGRGITQHKKFIKNLECPVLKIESDIGVNEKIRILSECL